MRVPMTSQGATLLREELEHLTTVKRPEIIQAIAEARAHGDLKENAEYHAAREQQSFAEGRILELESKLANAQVIDVSSLPQNGQVVFGVTVHLSKVDNGETVTYQIVGEDEANIEQGKISVTSPVASAMIGKEIDDSVKVQTPSGVIEYEIIEIEYK